MIMIKEGFFMLTKTIASFFVTSTMLLFAADDRGAENQGLKRKRVSFEAGVIVEEINPHPLQEADLKQAEAFFDTAFAYKDGKGVDQNPQMCRILLTKSAALGYMLAQKNLGMMLYEGTYLPQDLALAKIHLDLAAAQGDLDSQLLLATWQLSTEQTKFVPAR